MICSVNPFLQCTGAPDLTALEALEQTRVIFIAGKNTVAVPVLSRLFKKELGSLANCDVQGRLATRSFASSHCCTTAFTSAMFLLYWFNTLNINY